MGVKVYGELQQMELYFWWEQPERGARVAIGDREAARALLSRLHARGNGPALRRLIREPAPASWLDDDALLDLLAGWLASGTVRVAAARPEPLSGRDEARAEEEAPARPVEPRPDVPVEEEEEEDLDQLDQAEVLREAAKRGVPFCEECENGAQERAREAGGEAAQAAL